jgi:hypothetical protein
VGNHLKNKIFLFVYLVLESTLLRISTNSSMSSCSSIDKSDKNGTFCVAMEAWKHGSMEVWKYGSMEAWKHGSMEAFWRTEGENRVKIG